MTNPFAALVTGAFAALPTGLKVTVTFNRAARTLDATNGNVTTTTTSGTTTGSAVANDVKRFQELGLVLLSPVTLLVASESLAGFVPAPGDTFIFASTTYTVRDVISLVPDGTPLLYTVVGSL